MEGKALYPQVIEQEKALGEATTPEGAPRYPTIDSVIGGVALAEAASGPRLGDVNTLVFGSDTEESEE